MRNLHGTSIDHGVTDVSVSAIKLERAAIVFGDTVHPGKDRLDRRCLPGIHIDLTTVALKSMVPPQRVNVPSSKARPNAVTVPHTVTNEQPVASVPAAKVAIFPEPAQA